MEVLLDMQTVENLAKEISMGKVFEAGLANTCFRLLSVLLVAACLRSFMVMKAKQMRQNPSIRF